MTGKETILILKILKESLKETGKDEPLRDELIPIFKEALQIAIKELEKTY